MATFRTNVAHVCAPLLNAEQQHPYRLTSVCDGRTCTGRQWHRHVCLLSWAFTTYLDVQKGDRIALLGLNSDVLFKTMLASTDCGGICCPLNWRWSAFELAAALQLVNPKVVCVDEQFLPHLIRSLQAYKGSQPCVVGLLASKSIWSQPAASGQDSVIPPDARSQLQTSTSAGSSQVQTPAALHTTAEQLIDAAAAALCHATNRATPSLQLLQPACATALICFTSGTTGMSKGVALSHGALTHQVGVQEHHAACHGHSAISEPASSYAGYTTSTSKLVMFHLMG